MVSQPKSGVPVGSENSSGASASGSAPLCFPSSSHHPAHHPVVQRGNDDGRGCPSAAEAVAPQLSASGGGSYVGVASGQGQPAAESRAQCGLLPVTSPHPPLATSLAVSAATPTGNFGAASSMMDMAAVASMWGSFGASQPQLPNMPPQVLSGRHTATPVHWHCPLYALSSKMFALYLEVLKT